MDEREISVMNVIPFVDIMLVLLTIVLLTATFITIGKIPVNLPQAQGEVYKEKTVTIFISKEGEIFYNEELVSKKEFEERLDRLPRETSIFVGADKALTVNSLVEILDLIKTKGFTRISIGVKRT